MNRSETTAVTTANAALPVQPSSRLPGELPTGAALAPPSPSGSDSDPGGFVHLAPLDGIRGLAIAAILVYHLMGANNQASSRVIQLLIQMHGALWMGVDLFFALSGFLITGILFDALHSRHFLRNFYGRRIVRIFPLYFLALAVLALLTYPLHIQWNGLGWYLVFFAANFPGWQLHLPASAMLASHLWSLSTEEQFYLFWPFLVLLLRDRRRLMRTALLLSAVALLLRIVMVLHGAPAGLTYTTLPTRMDGLLLGGWLALAIRGPERDAVVRKGWLALLLAALALLFIGYRGGFAWQTNRAMNAVGYTLTALASTGLIALALTPFSRTGRFFSLPWLRSLGRYSFGIYVWHPILAALLLLPLRDLAGHFTANKLLRLGLSSLVMIPLSILAGVVSYHLFEVHFLRLKRYFAYGR